MCHASHQSCRPDFLLAYLRHWRQDLSQLQSCNLGDRHICAPLVDQHLLRHSLPYVYFRDKLSSLLLNLGHKTCFGSKRATLLQGPALQLYSLPRTGNADSKICAECNPIPDNWGTNPLQLPGCPSNIIVMYQTAAFTNLVSDIVILALPFTPMRKLQLPMAKKIAVLCIFMTGAM